MKTGFYFAQVTLCLVISTPLLITSVHAADCRPLTLLTSIETLPAKDRLAMLVPAEIDGVKEIMLLDTGGFFSELTTAAATDLKLGMRHTGVQLVGVAGGTTTVAARADTFTIGRLKASNIDFMVGAHEFSAVSGIAGILAPNLLTSYDIELDFAANKMSFLSQDHCEGKVVYWPASAAAVVPIRVARSGHIVVPVELDGHRLDALLDTGATSTALNRRIAEGDFGLTMGSADTPAVDTGDEKDSFKVYRHRFGRLAFEGVAILNPSVDIIPDRMRNLVSHAAPTGTRFKDQDEAEGLPDLLIGMDVLRHLHLYIAYREKRLYVTPGAASPAASKDAPAATAQ